MARCVHADPRPHLLLGLAPEAQAGGPLLIPISIIGASLVRLQLHHLGTSGTGEYQSANLREMTRLHTQSSRMETPRFQYKK